MEDVEHDEFAAQLATSRRLGVQLGTLHYRRGDA